MTRAVVVGYASVDTCVGVDRFEGVGRTSLISRAARQPEAGGIARLFAGLKAFNCAAISWVGMDAGSQMWVDTLNRMGVDTTGVTALEGGAPSAYLFHSASGETVCFFDPGVADAGAMLVPEEQYATVSAADVVVIAVGPSRVTREVLARISDTCTLVWIVKADPDAFPLSLRTQLLDRADIVVHSHQEDGFVREAAGGAVKSLIIRTAGAESVHWARGDAAGQVPVQAVASGVDATGAGDWFAGHLIGAHLSGSGVTESIESAVKATHQYLLSRG